jgi:hypothetical protein
MHLVSHAINRRLLESRSRYSLSCGKALEHASCCAGPEEGVVVTLSFPKCAVNTCVCERGVYTRNVDGATAVDTARVIAHGAIGWTTKIIWAVAAITAKPCHLENCLSLEKIVCTGDETYWRLTWIVIRSFSQKFRGQILEFAKRTT